MPILFTACPTCGADTDMPCRTPSGRKRASVHDYRPFAITSNTLTKEEEHMARKVTQIDKRITVAYRSTCSNILIDMMDIPKIFSHGRKLCMEGADDAALCEGIRAYVETIRQDR